MSAHDLFASGKNPSVIVLDCDWTIWPFDCDKDVVEPFVPNPYGGVFDRYSRCCNPYIEVPTIISAAVTAGIPIAFLSRNPSAGSVEALLRCIQIKPKTQENEEPTFLWDAMPSTAFFHCYSSKGYGTGKDLHFANLRKNTGIPFSEMLFFDDMPDNIYAAMAQGTVSVRVKKHGFTLEALNAGLALWREKKAFEDSAPAAAAVAAGVAAAVAPEVPTGV